MNKAGINETAVMETIWLYVDDNKKASGIGEAYAAELSYNNYRNPGVDKLFNNTVDYIAATMDLEGASADVISDRCIAESVQAHVATFVENRPDISTRLTARDGRLYNAFIQKRNMMASVLDDYAQSQAELEQARATTGNRRSYARGSSRLAAETNPVQQPAAQAHTTGRTRGRRVAEVHVEQNSRGRGNRIRGGRDTRGHEVEEVQEVVNTAPITPFYELGKIVKKKESNVDYNVHQALRVFKQNSAIMKSEKPENFEVQLRTAPIVRFDEMLDGEPAGIEVMHATEEGGEFNSIPMFDSPMLVSSIREAADAVNVMTCLTPWASPHRQASIAMFTVATPVWLFSDRTTADITINSGVLYDLVTENTKAQPYGLATLHTNLVTLAQEEQTELNQRIFERLNRRATDAVNDMLQYALCDDGVIDNFVDDFPAVCDVFHEKLSVLDWRTFIGEDLAEGERRNTAGGLATRRLLNYGVYPITDYPLLAHTTSESAVAVMEHMEASVIACGCTIDDLGIEFTTMGYNLLDLDVAENSTDVFNGIMRLFFAARMASPDGEIYLVTVEGSLFHIREIMQTVDGTPTVNFGIKFVSNR